VKIGDLIRLKEKWTSEIIWADGRLCLYMGRYNDLKILTSWDDYHVLYDIKTQEESYIDSDLLMKMEVVDETR